MIKAFPRWQIQSATRTAICMDLGVFIIRLLFRRQHRSLWLTGGGIGRTTDSTLLALAKAPTMGKRDRHRGRKTVRQKVNLSSHCLGGMSGMGAKATCPPPEQARRTILLLPAGSLPHDSNSSLETSSHPHVQGSNSLETTRS